MPQLSLGGFTLDLRDEVALYTAARWFMQATESAALKEVLGDEEALGYHAVLDELCERWDPSFAAGMHKAERGVRPKRPGLEELVVAALQLAHEARVWWAEKPEAASQALEAARSALFDAAEQAARSIESLPDGPALAVPGLSSSLPRMARFHLAREIFTAAVGPGAYAPAQGAEQNPGEVMVRMIEQLILPALGTKKPMVVPVPSAGAADGLELIELPTLRVVGGKEYDTLEEVTLPGPAASDAPATFTDFEGRSRALESAEAWIAVSWPEPVAELFPGLEWPAVRAVIARGMQTLFVTLNGGHKVDDIVGCPVGVVFDPRDPERTLVAVKFMAADEGVLQALLHMVHHGLYQASWGGHRNDVGPTVTQINLAPRTRTGGQA